MDKSCGWKVPRNVVSGFGSQGRARTTEGEVADFELVRRSRKGDGGAFGLLIKRHQGQVGKIMWRFSRDRTVHEELVQDAFVEAYLSLDGYRGRAPFSHWLARIATRVGYHYWRQQARRRRTETYSLEEWDGVDRRGAGESEAAEAAELVHGLLERLPAKDRLVLTLRYIDGCSVAETAGRTGWTQSLVKVRTWRARKKLQKLMAGTRKETDK
jgi:RNA polymerase sigma-70 factor (ECF subfamily)